MGLLSNDLLSALCPGRIGPTDLDAAIYSDSDLGPEYITAAIHNGVGTPERIGIVEYKGGAPVGQGQKLLFGAIQGEWTNPQGQALTIKVFMIPLDHEPELKLREAVDWTFQGRRVRAQLRPSGILEANPF
jgi:hypothetical protein